MRLVVVLHAKLTPLASLHVGTPATNLGAVVQKMFTAPTVVEVVIRAGQAKLQVPCAPTGALQYAVSNLALKASAPPTTATRASDNNMNFIFFIIEIAFYHQKAKVWFKNMPTLFLVVFGLSTFVSRSYSEGAPTLA